MKSNLYKVIGGLLCVVVISGLAYVASAAEIHDTTTGISVSRSFDTVSSVEKADDERINVVSAKTAASWQMSDSVVPYAFRSYATRSAEGFVDPAEYGIGKSTPAAAGNTYVPGQCTWYVYNRRAQLGRPIGFFWGDGGMWGRSASMQGFTVNHIPEIGAVFEEPGHVALVEEIGKDNSVRISEMNYNYIPYNYNERWVQNADLYIYIH